jgi:hypothetical protein
MKSRHLAVSRSPCLDKSGPDFHLGSSPGGIIDDLRAFTKPLARQPEGRVLALPARLRHVLERS